MHIQTTIKALILAAVLDLPASPTTIPEINIVISIAKIGAWYILARSTWKIAKEANLIYRTAYVVIYEHRMLTSDLWERRPDKFRDFQAMIQNPQPPPPPERAKGAAAR